VDPAPSSRSGLPADVTRTLAQIGTATLSVERPISGLPGVVIVAAGLRVDGGARA
jgi:hypothetical protein